MFAATMKKRSELKRFPETGQQLERNRIILVAKSVVAFQIRFTTFRIWFHKCLKFQAVQIRFHFVSNLVSWFKFRAVLG